jgi:predicted dehydrogenase
MSSQKPLNLLVVGTKFGSEYLQAAKNSSNWNICGIVARTEDSLQKAREKFNLAKECCFNDLKAALDALPETDAVAITVPNEIHHKFAKIVLEAKKHLILEKPIVVTWDEAIDLIKVLDTNPNGKAMVGQTLRGITILRMLAYHLNKGIIGDIEQMTFLAHWHWLDDPEKSWRFKLKNMYLDDIGIHQFDLIRMLLGNRKCKKIIGKSFNPKSYPVDINSTASGIMTFEDDIHLNYFASMSTKGKDDIGWYGRIEIFGTKGSILKEANGQPMVFLEDKDGNRKKFGLDDEYGEDLDEYLPLIEFDKIAYLLEDFYYAITEDRAPVTDLRDNLNTFAILLGLKESAISGKEIDIDQQYPQGK